ncbi:carbon monoxide dehydrogenase subunit G [Thermobaculum terrenum ATCC BAA-798]|uniref:Carbon monoxide dehydrogenase subunit G n=1 Tax=Thermobaculum terrenum (strain ATCC BAA-798 / CCMEE 7001 / YNP1) TaxID=525904 RepID=D1CHB3_THET1|nr:carbon monoxide dehydrogenase subunit G [Thermobaculum terrenum]ACZ43134.1 carbon monoxide dehydrogenase subunit G [Thermobaculum terrenum ATCC BAA-798]
MKLDGSYTMHAPRQLVFETLQDPEALRGCLPGVESFEAVGDGRYEATGKAGVAGIRGSYSGTVILTDQKPPESYQLSAEGSFSGGRVTGTATITLVDQGDKTVINYIGEAQLSGPLASVGQRLLTPAAKMMARQFFKCMEDKVKSKQAATSS